MKLKQKSSWITYKEMLNKVKNDSVKSWLTENGPITKRISANEDFELSLIPVSYTHLRAHETG